MSNSLIFYKQLDPSGDVSKLDEKTKKAYEAFFKPLPLSAFKDYLKRCRLSFINPKDKNVLTGWSQDFMIDHVFYPLISETINGEVKEVKGNINETIRIIFNEEKSAKNQEQLDEEKIKQAKKKILSVISSVVSQLFSAYEEKQKSDSLKAFEAEDEFTKTLNDVNELLDAVGFKSGELVELHEVIKSKWIIYQQNLLVRLINRVINEKYFLTKHVDMIGDLLRNISSTINRLSDLISNDFVEVVSQQLETLLNNCLRLKKDIVSHAAILFVYIKIAKKKEPVESVINEILSIEDTNDEKSLEKLGKVRALFTYDGKNIPFHKYNMIEYVNGFFNSSNPEIRLYCMTVMHLILENISQSVYKGEFMKNESLQCEIYDNVQRSLEYPAKKISYWIDSILTALISCSENPTKFAEKYATEALELNLSSSKRKYYLLTIILPFVSPDFYLEKDPHIIEELMIACGDFYILPAPNLLLRLLDTLYQNKCNQDLDQWRKYWENDYFTCLKTQPLQVVKGIISTVNPILAKINKNAVVYMLSTILDSASSIDDKNSLWIFVSFLKVARERSLIVDGPDGSFNLSGTKISITMDRLEKLILNKDRNIIINILEFISINPKPSEAPSELEFELLLLFLKFGTRTSYPEFRKDFIGSFKRFIERLRLVYERDIVLIESGKVPKKKNFKAFVNFIQKSIDIIFSSMYPSVCFEIANPMLEILNLILSNFPSHKTYEYKRGLVIQPSKFLQTQIVNPPLFSQSNFELLLVNGNSLWESVRQISVNILSFFPPETVSVEYVNKLYNHALVLCKNPQIRNYEIGAYILQLLFTNYLGVLGKTQIEFLKDLIQITKKSFENFTSSFLIEWQIFNDSLIHGLVTALAFIIQKMTKEQIQDQVEMKKVLNEMFSVICEILTFSTKISSENVATVVLDTGSSTKKVELDEDLEKQISKIDCRGHFIIDEESKQKNKFLQNMEKILQGNTLVEALEDNGAGEEGVGSENLLVVTFYLISREAGFLFQAISALVIASQEEDLDIFDKEGLESIVNQYFHTLVNIKHIGSIDRIAIGLNTMCKSMNEVKNPILPHLSHKLLEKLLDHIEQNTFRNTLRRSAGLPYAITCLLKAECAGKRTKSLPLAIKRLLDLIENSPHKQVKIHCLNIMKRIFEDSNIKLDVDKFIGQGFMTAIKGFAIEDWSIRNSSLMLFSALSLRTVGGAKNPNSQTIKSKLNLVEFFARAPQLLDFFIEEISNFVHTDKYANTQYPPLYPIALLFTRLLPYDLKNQVKKSPSASEEEDISTKQTEENADLTDQQPAGNQYIALTEVQKILPLLVECAKNKNYMGRVMVARSILPFMVFDKIPEESINLLNRIESYDMARKSHNFCHGILLQILNVLKNYYEMKKETGIHQDEVQAAQLAQTERLMAQKLQEKSYLLTKIKCPPVQYAYIDLLRAFIFNLKNENLVFALEQFKEIDQFSKSYIETQVASNSLRIQDDMGHSVLRKKLLRYTLRNRIIYESNKSVDLHLDYLLKVLKTYENNPTAYKDEDNEFLRVILKEFYIGLKEQEEVILKGSQQKINQLVELFICVLKNEHSHDYFFSQCITFIMKILFKLGLSDAIEKNHFSPFWDIIKVLEKKFNSNGLLVKQLVKFTGLLINNGSIDVKYFEYLCLTYSSSQQMDYLRIAVIISFNICMEKLVSTLQSSKNVEDFKIFLNFCFVFLRLLQDEVPEVRQKMSNFLCKKLFSNSEKKTSEDIFLFEVTIKRFFEFLCTQEVDVQNRKQLNFFLLKHLYEMEYFSIKKTNHIEQRIFAYDKSNKFIDDMRVKKYSYHYLIKNLKSQDPANPSLTLAEYENFISQSKYSFTSLTEERRNKYQNDFSYRDEYEFENKLNELLSNNIKNVLNNGEQISFNADIDPFIQYFYEL